MGSKGRCACCLWPSSIYERLMTGGLARSSPGDGGGDKRPPAAAPLLDQGVDLQSACSHIHDTRALLTFGDGLTSGNLS